MNSAQGTSEAWLMRRSQFPYAVDIAASARGQQVMRDFHARHGRGKQSWSALMTALGETRGAFDRSKPGRLSGLLIAKTFWKRRSKSWLNLTLQHH